MVASVDSLVHSITPYRQRPLWAHGYCGPFGVLYAVWLAVFVQYFGFDDYYELGCIGMGIIGLLQALTVLFCHWMVGIKCFMSCAYEPNAKNAEFVKVVPTPNNGWAELVPLKRSRLNDVSKLWFEFQRVHYLFDEEKKTFRTVEFDSIRKMSYFQESKGIESDDQLTEVRYNYGDNKMEMVIPQFWDMFKERATAPFFVFQVFCVGLWCFEDMWYYSLFTLFMLVTFEASLVKQQMRNMAEIRNMGNKSYMIFAYRNRKWIQIKSEDLVPGDVVSITRGMDEHTVPCDLLLLRGSCIVDESMLTGESVPQMKEPVDAVDKDRYLDIDIDGRLHVISGGTKIVQVTPPAKADGCLKAPDGGCVAFVLRTAFNTNQGKLLRTIMFGVKRVTANNLETFCFILFLLIFAIAASSYLWVVASADELRNKFKLFLECTLIITSVIPPELPIELSLAVNTSLIALQKLGVFCTEPFRIPFAGKIDVCCFDKTGTLTTDNLVVEGIAVSADEEKGMVRSPADADPLAVQVLACCHSLVRFDEDLVGDPLEKACLTWVDWNLTKGDSVVPRKGKQPGLKIFHRYHFSSAMKRMTVSCMKTLVDIKTLVDATGRNGVTVLHMVIAGYQKPGFVDTNYIVAVKGAPETLREMYVDLPSDYDTTYQTLTRQGARVLALGVRDLGPLTFQEMRDSKRERFECDLRFAGFVVISCPLKPDTKAMIKEIIDSSHQVVMITGDNPLTACHVANVLKFTNKRLSTLVLDEPSEDGNWAWKSVDETETFPAVPEKKSWKTFFMSHEFCITGAAFTYLTTEHLAFFRALLPGVRVYARMAPKQKERVIHELKQSGKVTLMCGDGTNDVGALKHANVGVALLSHPFDATKSDKQKEKQEEEKREKEREKEKKAVTAVPPPHVGRRGDAPAGARHRTNPGVSNAQKKLEQMMKELEEEEKSQVVRLGDASIAAPFTSKYTSIQSISHVIKQGRCTLVTTLQMFKILALNALVSAYSLSVLYLDGVKFSDTQATIQGLLLAACFLFVSRSKPLKTLSRQRPMANIFNAYTLLTVTMQFALHFAVLLYIVQLAHEYEPRDAKIDLESKFSPNILNSTVYIISMALQVCTFAVNYRGRPFMESLWENKPMLYSVLFSGFSVFSLATGASDDMVTQFELVKLPTELRDTLVYCVLGDLVGCYVIDRGLNFFLGDMF